MHSTSVKFWWLYGIFMLGWTILLATVTLLCAWQKVATDNVTSQETIQHNDETPCQRRSWLSGALTSPEVCHSEFVTYLSRSPACCLWAGSWAGGHWDARSAAGLAVRFPPGRPGWRGPRCSEIWAGRVPGPGSESGQLAPLLQASPFPLTWQGKHTHTWITARMRCTCNTRYWLN